METTTTRPPAPGKDGGVRQVARALLGMKPPERISTRPPGHHWQEEEVGRLERDIRWLKVWRGVLLAAVAIAYGATLVLALRPESFYLVVADAGGKILYEGKPNDFSIPDLFIETQLKAWINLVRSRSDDPVVNTLGRDKALGMTTGEASLLLEAYLGKVKEVETQNPGHRWRVITSFSSPSVKLSGTITKLSRTEYRMIWTEDWTPTIGVGKKVIVMEGTFRVTLREKTGPLGTFQITVAQHQQAPFGVYIEWFTWNAMTEGAS
jgi:type IV secretory pathway TrbF-like protein